MSGVQVERARPGTLVILCEGKNRDGFFICLACGRHMEKLEPKHKSPSNYSCEGILGRFSLGYELVTDVVSLQFPQVSDDKAAYSLAYALLLGSAEALGIPNSDLNVTITGNRETQNPIIVLYDDVPGGAGLVAQMEKETLFEKAIHNARKRVAGGCGCDSSCYGCLRSYRNQFIHPDLDRKRALEILESIPVP